MRAVYVQISDEIIKLLAQLSVHEGDCHANQDRADDEMAALHKEIRLLQGMRTQIELALCPSLKESV